MCRIHVPYNSTCFIIIIIIYYYYYYLSCMVVHQICVYRYGKTTANDNNKQVSPKGRPPGMADMKCSTRQYARNIILSCVCGWQGMCGLVDGMACACDCVCHACMRVCVCVWRAVCIPWTLCPPAVAPAPCRVPLPPMAEGAGVRVRWLVGRLRGGKKEDVYTLLL